MRAFASTERKKRKKTAAAPATCLLIDPDHGVALSCIEAGGYSPKQMCEVCRRVVGGETKKEKPRRLGYCNGIDRDHKPGKLIADTGDIRTYPCLHCGLVFWTPRKR